MARTGIIVQLTGVLSTLSFPDLQVEVKTSSANKANLSQTSMGPSMRSEWILHKKIRAFSNGGLYIRFQASVRKTRNSTHDLKP